MQRKCQNHVQRVISLHSCFTIQRKGSNGNNKKWDKDDLNHPGNNLQIKIKPKALSDLLDPIMTIKYSD